MKPPVRWYLLALVLELVALVLAFAAGNRVLVVLDSVGIGISIGLLLSAVVINGEVFR